MITKIGFTGTQLDMNDYQEEIIAIFLLGSTSRGKVELHHGDCIGADATFHLFGRALEQTMVGHPPINESKRTFTDCDVWFPAKDYLVRNRCIVDSTEFLIACSATDQEIVRSGTWSTVRYARECKKPGIIVYPKDVEFF